MGKIERGRERKVGKGSKEDKKRKRGNEGGKDMGGQRSKKEFKKGELKRRKSVDENGKNKGNEG